jgi:glycosyltransferase involved in cell wall biosynthesis
VNPERAEAGGERASERLAAIVAAHNEVDRVGMTLAALEAAFPGAELWVADDASTDGTIEAGFAAGGRVVCGAGLRTGGRPRGKGANVTTAARTLLDEGFEGLVLLCDADLGESAGRLGPLVEAVERGECDLAVAGFARRVGGGFGVALAFARWAVERLAGVRLESPISGQRAMRAESLRELLPFAPGFGMEVGMDVDAVRAGLRIREYELDLAHRATGRTAAGFLHRGRQLRDFARVYLSRRRG